MTRITFHLLSPLLIRFRLLIGYLFLVMAFCLFSCTSKNEIPKEILKPKLMRSIFWDFTRAEIYAHEYIKKDSTKNDSIILRNMQQSILLHYKTSKLDYDRSYEYYVSHPDLMAEILDSILSGNKKTDSIEIKHRFRLE